MPGPHQHKRLIEIMPQPDDNMSAGEVRLLMAMNIIASRIDDVIQPGIDEAQVNTGKFLDAQGELINSVEEMGKLLRNGTPKDQSIRNYIMENKTKSLLAMGGVLTVLPWLQRISAALIVGVAKEWLGVDLPAILPFLFGAG